MKITRGKSICATASQQMLSLFLAVSIIPNFCMIRTAGAEAIRQQRLCTKDEEKEHPILCAKVQHLIEDPDTVENEINAWARSHNLLVDLDYSSIVADEHEEKGEDDYLKFLGKTKSMSFSSVEKQRNRFLRTTAASAGIPVVMAHGMGDSCFNDGMKGITEHISDLLSNEKTSTYSTCIPTGSTQQEDTVNGFFLNMDASVDIFAEKVRNNTNLDGGFHAVGFSQGNNIIRGYIARYNDPPVKTFISINGVNAGESGVPHCNPSLSSLTGFPSWCDLLMEQASRAAYTEYAQKHSFQANYWRDPRPVEFPSYLKYAQLARWNNEGVVNQTFVDNWSKTEQYVWILATEDTMVWPREGEQWGAPDPKDPFRSLLPREQTRWFKEDLFGLRTAEEQGKNKYESFEGDHLRFSMKEFNQWIQKYLAQQ